MTTRTVLGTALLATLAACTPPEPVRMPWAGPEHARVMAMPMEPARDRLAAEMRSLGFTVDTAPGRVRGMMEKVPPEWTACVPVRATDPFQAGKFRDEMPRGALAIVIADVQPVPAGTSAHIDLKLIGRYVNTYTNTPFDASCASTGVLEERLLNVLGPPVAGT